MERVEPIREALHHRAHGSLEVRLLAMLARQQCNVIVCRHHVTVTVMSATSEVATSLYAMGTSAAACALPKRASVMPSTSKVSEAGSVKFNCAGTYRRPRSTFLP